MKCQIILNYFSKYVWSRPRHAFLKLISEAKAIYFMKKSSMNTELNGVILEQQHSSILYSIQNPSNSNDF